MPRQVHVGVAAVALLALPSCDEGSDQRTIVASFYPLAYAAEEIAGPVGWRVIDLSAGQGDAHDIELSLDDRVAIEEADLVLYLGDLGFQPEVERAVDEAEGTVVAVADDVALRREAAQDPHIWLDIDLFGRLMFKIETALEEIDPGPPARYDEHGLEIELGDLQLRYERALDECRYETIVVPHEAFGYLARGFGLRQFGLSGPVPEGEPTVARVAEAQRLIADGDAGAVFHDGTAESIRIAESVASGTGVPVLRLRTLETPPELGDYVSVMKLNLTALTEGLGCR